MSSEFEENKGQASMFPPNPTGFTFRIQELILDDLFALFIFFSSKLVRC